MTQVTQLVDVHSEGTAWYGENDNPAVECHTATYLATEEDLAQLQAALAVVNKWYDRAYTPLVSKIREKEDNAFSQDRRLLKAIEIDSSTVKVKFTSVVVSQGTIY